MTLPSVTDFAKWLNTATDARNNATARELAMTHMLAAYAKAERGVEECDCDKCTHWARVAVHDALEAFRAVRNESRSDANLDRLADSLREENEEKQREVELENDVPWGREHK